MSIFALLDVYHDDFPRSAAMNMAIDEALLQVTDTSSLRFYRWDHPALSFGYFGKFADIADYAADRDLVRRWTGGGIVLHGDDLTYSIIIPATAEFFGKSSKAIYAEIHGALRDALGTNGASAQLAFVARDGSAPRTDDPGRRSDNLQTGVTDPGYNGHACFANPVPADVMVNGQKVAGAAHRRTRAGLLHQGSIQHVALGIDFVERFADCLAENRTQQHLDGVVLERAHQITDQKYATTAWLRKR